MGRVKDYLQDLLKKKDGLTLLTSGELLEPVDRTKKTPYKTHLLREVVITDQAVQRKIQSVSDPDGGVQCAVPADTD